jgi:integrase
MKVHDQSRDIRKSPRGRRFRGLDAFERVETRNTGPLTPTPNSRLTRDRHNVKRKKTKQYDVGGLTRDTRPHGLRHEAITRALDRTHGDIRTVQRFSRHADPKTAFP